MLHATAPVPARLDHDSFVAVPLTTANAALDYAAYISSPDVLAVHSDGRWSVEGFTLEQDREQIAKHQADHEARRAFTFLLLDPTESEALGCVYLNPLHDYLRRVGADAHTLDAIPANSAMVTFWIRQDLQHTGLTDEVAEGIHTWLRTRWRWATYVFRILPGERTSRSALERLPLRRVDLDLPGEERPYLWYEPTGVTAESRS